VKKIINLTSWEYGEALREAHYRHANWKGGHSYQHHDQREANVLGVCGEAAAAKYLMLDYVRGTDWTPGMADLGHDIEVKTSFNPVLILQGNNNRHRRYICVTKQKNKGFHYVIEGWAYGSEVFQNGILHPPGSPRGGKHGSHWLDARMLHDPEELRASLLLEQN
jgi:hypothetical protein